MIKSPLRYPGGKSRAIPFLSRFIRPCSELREVFFGGGSFSFYVAANFPEVRLQASDLNFELYCFWQQLGSNPAALVQEIEKIYHQWKPGGEGKALFHTILSRRDTDLSDLQRAADFFVLNRISFSGVVDSSGYSHASFEGRFTQSAIRRLKQAAEVAAGISFYCEDFSYLINQPGEDVLLFLDPPYYNATASRLYGKNGLLHLRFDHEGLYRSLLRTKHHWLLTYDNSPFIRERYKDFYCLPWSLQYGMTNSQSEHGNELLISNYDIRAVMASGK